MADSRRLDELDSAISRAEDALWTDFNRGQEKVASSEYVGEAESRAARARNKALQDQVDLLKAKRANVEAGIPEDTGLAVPIDLEAMIERRFEALDKRWQQRFAKFQTALGKGLADVINERIGKGGLSYKGTWQRAASYGQGDVVTHEGSAWCAVKAVKEGEKPGTADSWQLMVKCGRDGKDAR